MLLTDGHRLAQLKWLMRLTRERMEALATENAPERVRLHDLESRAGRRLIHCSTCLACRLCF